MYSNYTFTRALVSDHQHGLYESARLHRLAAFGRTKRSQPPAPAGVIVAEVHYLPTRNGHTGDGETRAAS
jgi:hypothetical protein